jgi:hypothetical protein
MLNESHKIFVMEILREQYSSQSGIIYGYIDSDILNMEELLKVFHKGLMDEYERMHRTRKGAHQIIRELMPNNKDSGHSIMGNLLNKSVMLDSYLYLLKKNNGEYTEAWKAEHLQKQILMYENAFRKDFNKNKKSKKDDKNDKDNIEIKEDSSSQAAAPRRAVDSPLMDDFTDNVTKVSVARMLHIYGVNFFFRVNLRKYQFTYLSQVIDTGVIDRKKDLLMIKDMLTKVKENIHQDKGLEKYYDDIMSLDIKIARSISSSKK